MKSAKYLSILLFLFGITAGGNIFCQTSLTTKSLSSLKVTDASNQSFIENIGQYGATVPGYSEMGTVKFGYENFNMPVLFTSKGLIHLQRKIEKISHKEEERLERQGIPEDEIENQKKLTDRIILMEWIGSDPDVTIVSSEKTLAYHTYGTLSAKANGYRKLTYKNIYPGIDILYSFSNNSKTGFEYSLVVRPGADLSRVRMRYAGDVKKFRLDRNGNLMISSDIEGIECSAPQTSYPELTPDQKTEPVNIGFRLENAEVSFSLPQGYDGTKTLIIDPFVTATGNLTGLNAGKAKDVDFDYAGNVYVTGGGSGTNHQLAKFNSAGVLQWTFSGTLTIPTWTFGTYWGGWMVEKPTGNIYLGQGFHPGVGFQVIRVSTTGLYDNFITAANPSFMEAWKMLWSCNNGSPQVLVAGGGTNSNINFGVFTPPSTSIGSLNVTGIPYTGAAGWAQDVVDFIIDPSNNDMYTIYGSLFGNPSLTNQVYKNTAPYSSASVAWKTFSGFTSVQEIANRPYLLGGQIDNSANIFAINAGYLFYWDGKNLKAFDKASGNSVGTPLVTSNTKLMQGGIIADACNNVFVGDGNGIKVYQFNGSVFDDAAAADISIPGFNGHAVYDLAYDESKKLLYCSGDGFVGSFDVSSYCPATQYSLTVSPNCLAGSATATINPLPAAGSTISFTLYIGGIAVTTNSTGAFTGLNANTTYNITATINQSCSGSQATTTFIFPGPLVNVTFTNATCGNNTGSITASASGTIAPYLFSIDGTNFQASGSFNALAAGIYALTVKDSNGCSTKSTVTVLNTNGPQLALTSTSAACGINNGSVTINVSGGTAPFQFSLNGSGFQNNNFFTGLSGGNYIITVKDAGGCLNSGVVTVSSTPSPLLDAIPAAATCGSNNGTITAFGSAGTPPLQYSINGNIFQSGNVFNGLNPGNYTVTVKDANGCMKTAIVAVPDSPAPTVTALATAAACNNANGTITANGNGGINPLQYSINGGLFQSSNIFTGLAPGVYTVRVQDNTGCSNNTAVSVLSVGGPIASATATASLCSSNTGAVTIFASAGTASYQYSINGLSFQSGNVFSGLGAGNYVAFVKDANGCIGTTNITVPNTAGPSITAVTTSTACAVNNGTITATGNGTATPLQYSIDGTVYQTSSLFSGLASGIYTVYVKDANGCIKTTTVSLQNSSGLSLVVSNISSNCNSNVGVITAVATGGIAPLTYSLDGVTYQASNVFSGLATGIYTVNVKDAAGCIVSKQTTLLSITGPSLTVDIQQNATCGTASAVIRATGTGGTLPLTYNIDGGAFQAINIFINVAAGSHTITVKDATGCTVSQAVTITNSGTGNAITDVTFTIRDALACTGQTGKIKNLKGAPNGGGNTYVFSLDGGAFTTANQFTNVPVGVHTITAKNQDGCTITKLATIGNGIPATATAVVTASSCGAATGTITITGVGANTPYHASINNGLSWITFFPPGANSFTFSGLAPGTYSIIIADDADFTAGPPDIPGACLTTIYAIVPSIGGPGISTTQVNPSCNAATGNITAQGTAGTAPYSYNINGGPYFSSGLFNNLTSGAYAVTVKDASNCISGVNVALANNAIPAVTAVVQSTSCNQANGSIIATGTGGIAPLEFSLNGTTFQSSNIFSNLAGGSYTLYVKDANQCYSTIVLSVINTAIPKVTAYTIAATCNNNDGSIVASGSFGELPYTFSINGNIFQSSGTFSNLAAGFYTVYIKDARGCISTTGVSVENISTISISTIQTVSSSCGNANGAITINASGGIVPLVYSIDGINFQSGNIFSNLLPGNYAASVKDASGCIASKVVIVTNNTGPQQIIIAVIDPSCSVANGAVNINVVGGAIPLQYSLDGLSYQSGSSFTALGSGGYTIYVKDANGCVLTASATLVNLAAPTLIISPSPASCGLADGTITANATGGTGVLLYSLDGITFQSSNVFTGLTSGPYTVTVKDAMGCTSNGSTAINVIGASLLPLFNPVAPVCFGDVLNPLPTMSLNGVSGTWSPALNNTVTTTYSFTPSAGQCASSATLQLVIKPKPASIIIYHN